MIGAISYTTELAVRTNVEIDEEFMAMALRLSGLRTKRGGVRSGSARAH
jgi:Arc/MetJ family transcription regulator